MILIPTFLILLLCAVNQVSNGFAFSPARDVYTRNARSDLVMQQQFKPLPISKKHRNEASSSLFLQVTYHRGYGKYTTVTASARKRASWLLGRVYSDESELSNPPPENSPLARVIKPIVSLLVKIINFFKNLFGRIIQPIQAFFKKGDSGDGGGDTTQTEESPQNSEAKIYPKIDSEVSPRTRESIIDAARALELEEAREYAKMKLAEIDQTMKAVAERRKDEVPEGSEIAFTAPSIVSVDSNTTSNFTSMLQLQPMNETKTIANETTLTANSTNPTADKLISKPHDGSTAVFVSLSDDLDSSGLISSSSNNTAGLAVDISGISPNITSASTSVNITSSAVVEELDSGLFNDDAGPKKSA